MPTLLAETVTEPVAWKTLFSVAALFIAMTGFLAVIAGLVLKRNRKTHERASRLPLEED